MVVVAVAVFVAVAALRKGRVIVQEMHWTNAGNVAVQESQKARAIARAQSPSPATIVMATASAIRMTTVCAMLLRSQAAKTHWPTTTNSQRPMTMAHARMMLRFRRIGK